MDKRDSERGRDTAEQSAIATSGAYEWLLDQFAEIDRKYCFVHVRTDRERSEDPGSE